MRSIEDKLGYIDNKLIGDMFFIVSPMIGVGIQNPTSTLLP